ncbi:MAG: hypothetical protein KAS35_03830 [Candidatus Marinimicrobia bacterium]|nr:hypothetical protein [Candidatus Neomarinimicrobiota bacterium]
MKKFKTYLTMIILSAVLSGQIIWNEPPDTIWYDNGQRLVEVILPQPKILHAITVNDHQVKLTWDTFWTPELINAYTTKFGYAPNPNRYSFYRNGQALAGVLLTENEYIDVTTLIGQTYIYEYLASDANYQIVGGLQHWSPRSLPTTITVGENQSSLSCPSNFKGCYIPYPASIKLTWNSVSNATSYTIFKSYRDPTTNNWVYLSIPVPNANEYADVQLLPNQTYYYQMIAINGNINSNRSSTISITAGTLDFQTPNNFSGYYEPDSAMIILTWDYIKDANSYIIFKSFKDPENSNQWKHLSIPVGNINNYFDSELLPYVGYVYTLIAINGSIKSDRTNPLTINSGTLSIEDEEYWEAVEEYEKDRKIGWFSCSLNK